MKEKTKGFTLVELLAVIVILALIALIATPIILNVIEDAKKNAAIQSLNGYMDAIEKTITLNELNKKEGFPSADNSGCYNLKDLAKYVKIKGTKPTLAEGAKVCFTKGAITSITEIIIDGYKMEYESTTGIKINGKVVEKADEKEEQEVTGIPSKEYTQGETVSYLGYTWKVMKDNGSSTQLVMDGYLSNTELTKNLPSDVDSSNVSASSMRLCLHKNYGASNSDYNTVRDAFMASVGNYCYNLWNGEAPNEIRGYTWKKSIVKPTIENWLERKMTEKGLTKEKELTGMSFNDGVENVTGYVRIPTYDDVKSIGVYSSIDKTNYMYDADGYLIMTASGNSDTNYVYTYIYIAAGVHESTGTDIGHIRPVITVNEQ